MSHVFEFKQAGKTAQVLVTRRVAPGGGVYVQIDRVPDDLGEPDPVIVMFDRALAVPIALAILEECEN